MGPADPIQIGIWRKNKAVKSLQLCRHCLHRSLLQALQRAIGTCFKARKPLEAYTQPSPRAQVSSLQWRAEQWAPVKSQKTDSEYNSYLNKSLITPCSSALTVGQQHTVAIFPRRALDCKLQRDKTEILEWSICSSTCSAEVQMLLQVAALLISNCSM